MEAEVGVWWKVFDEAKEGLAGFAFHDELPGEALRSAFVEGRSWGGDRELAEVFFSRPRLGRGRHTLASRRNRPLGEPVGRVRNRRHRPRR